MVECLTCFLPFLVLAAAAAAVFFFFLKRRDALARRRQADVTNRLVSSIGRLEADPRDDFAIEQIVASTSDTSWVPQVPWQPAKSLWQRALTFAFAHLDLPAGQTVAYRVIVPLADSPAGDGAQLTSVVHQAVAKNPTNRAIHDVVLNVLRGLVLDTSQRQWLYDRMLDLVQQSPRASELSVIALEIGRWYLGRSRPEGKVTVYDEQAIQNDIAVRRGTT